MIDPEDGAEHKNGENDRPADGQASNTTKVEAKEEAKTAASKKRKPISNLDDLLRLIYSGKRSNIVPNKKEINALRESVDNYQLELPEILNLAKTDRTLGRTLDLFFICAEKFTLPKLVQQTHDFIKEVLLIHPAYVKGNLANVLLGGPDAMLDVDAVQSIVKLDYGDLAWPDVQEGLKKPEVSQCRLNAISCLLMWMRTSEQLSMERIQRLLDVNLWQPAAKNCKSELIKLKTLLNSKEPGSLALARENLIRELNAQYKDTEAAKSSEQKVLAELLVARKRIKELETKLAGKNNELEKSQKQGQELETKYGDTLAHKADDYEKLRARMYRRLKAELELLDVGLGALRRDPPKVHVMIDHAERAIDGLKQELERLQRNG